MDYTILLTIAVIGTLIIFGIGILKKKKVKAYLKIWKIFEGSIETED
ncbi:hypothetical protein J2X97_002140 [Epilithonimonas hungarica]|nr:MULTISPECIES: hypothetical protein [Epilithonimonas]MDP9956481.1 hypothetical protein [Epilithonimonas hungarica]